MRAWRHPDTENGRIAIIDLRYFKFCIAHGGGAAVGGSLRSSLSGSRPTSHSQGHGRPCLTRLHLRPRFRKTWMEHFPELLTRAQKKETGEHSAISKKTCERRDSNPYARRHQILSLAWLPITTRSQIPSGRLIT